MEDEEYATYTVIDLLDGISSKGTWLINEVLEMDNLKENEESDLIMLLLIYWID